MTPEEIRHKLLTPAFPIPKLTELLDHDNQQMRQDFRYVSNFDFTGNYLKNKYVLKENSLAIF